jgi:hypothetical protein
MTRYKPGAEKAATATVIDAKPAVEPQAIGKKSAIKGKSSNPGNTAGDAAPAREVGGRDGLDPTRYGDWENKGRCVDF